MQTYLSTIVKSFSKKWFSFIASAFVVLFAFTPALTAQEVKTILPGDKEINAPLLRPFQAKYVRKNPWYMFWDRVNGYTTVELKVAEHRGIPCYVLTYKMETDDGGTIFDEMRLSKTTLEAIGRQMNNLYDGYDYDIAINENELNGTLTPLKGTSQKKATLTISGNFPHSAFEPSLVDYIIATMPLHENFTAKLPFIELAKKSTIQWVQFTVMGKERVKAGDQKTYDTWVVQTKYLTGNRQGEERKFWLSSTAPYKIKAETSVDWELLEVKLSD